MEYTIFYIFQLVFFLEILTVFFLWVFLGWVGRTRGFGTVKDYYVGVCIL